MRLGAPGGSPGALRPSLARHVHFLGGMTTATHAQIVELLGDADDLFVKRIADTGASLDEIGEALGDLQSEDVLGEPPRIASSPRVAEVRAILEELMDTEDDDLEEGYRTL